MRAHQNWIIPGWQTPPGVRALVTTRSGGVSHGAYASMNLALHVGDDPAAVRHNRSILAQRIVHEPCWLEQVHGAEVAEAVEGRSGPVCADASIATAPGAICVVMTADCLPVLLCDTSGSVVAAAHAGWRGLAGGILEATVARMAVSPDTVMAWLGPAIGPQAFEVGEEVRERFVAADRDTDAAFQPGAGRGKWMADLFMLARIRLAGVGVTRVSGGGVCTYADRERFYSYRREGTTGRFASMVWRG